MTFQLSDRAKQLIPLARIVNLAKLGVGAGRSPASKPLMMRAAI